MPADTATEGAVPAGRARVPVVVLVFVSAVTMGGNYVSLKEALRYSSPVALAAVRASCGALVLLAVARLRHDRFPRLRELPGIFGVSVSLTTVSTLGLIYGVQRVPSGVAALMSSTMPLVSLLLAIVILREWPDRRARGGLAVGILGAAVLASPALTGETSAAGLGYLLLATATWALGVILQKALGDEGVSPFMFVAVQLCFSAVTLGALTFVLEDGFADFHLRRGLALPLFYSSVLAMALPFSLMLIVVRRATAVQASAVAYLVPFFGVLAAWLVRGESLHAAELVGGVIVVAGVALVNAPRRRPQRESGAPPPVGASTAPSSAVGG